MRTQISAGETSIVSAQSTASIHCTASFLPDSPSPTAATVPLLVPEPATDVPSRKRAARAHTTHSTYRGLLGASPECFAQTVPRCIPANPDPSVFREETFAAPGCGTPATH